MKKLFLNLGLAALTLASAHGQGTINPRNGTLTRVRIEVNNNGTYDSTDAAVLPSDGVRVGLFWGAAGGPADRFAGEMAVGDTPGVLTGLPAIFSVDGWGEAGTIISLEFCVIAGGSGRTGVKQVTLNAANGPGSVVWGSTATASRFSPLLVLPGGIPCVVPEPSTLALGGLACGFLLLRARKTFVRR